MVWHIFENYRDGLSRKRIALRLNQAGIASSCDGAWSSTINGSRERGTGILNSELYVGRLVWNRLQAALGGDLTMRKAELGKTKAQIGIAGAAGPPP